MPTIDELEEYLQSLEDLLFASVNAVTPDLFNRLWLDISRYGPGIPSFSDVHLPALGDFQVPPPPPPPPPPKSWAIKSLEWAERHPWKASGLAVGIVGAGLLVGYRARRISAGRVGRLKAAAARERRQVVVVLGGDTPLALALITDLEEKGYIVIASVATQEGAELVERSTHGYVRALILDPNEPDTLAPFLRQLSSTLSRRFPLTAAGDPHASPASHPYVHAVISLLTLPPTAPHAPLEHLALRTTYLPYLTATHIVPLQVVQALLPLLRSTPARARDAPPERARRTIIFCLPATDARVGLPFASMQAMSAAATLRGAEVLRREIRVAALTDRAEAMRNIRVIVADVGAFVDASAPAPPQLARLEGWTPAEKVTYGPAFAAFEPRAPSSYWHALRSFFAGTYQYDIRRRPADAAVFVDALVAAVGGGPAGPAPGVLGLGIGLSRVRTWLRGERFSLGAGAATYALASHLPATVLDALLALPLALIALRNRLLPTQPFVVPDSLAPAPPALAAVAHESDSGGEALSSDAGSEADVESNSGYGAGVEQSWISLQHDG